VIAARRGLPDLIERPPRPLAGPGRLLRDFGPLYAANGLIGMIFSATGPVAVILAVGTAGRLSPAELASWIFGVFFLNGLLTVLVGPALGHLSFAEVVGAYYATGLLMLVLGLSGWVRRAMAAVPMPIVMGMVAGVFLRFGTDLVHALRDDLAIAGPMVLAFLLASAWPRKWLPPIIVALLVGVVAVALSGRFDPGTGATQWLAAPVWQAPACGSRCQSRCPPPARSCGGGAPGRRAPCPGSSRRTPTAAGTASRRAP